MELINLKNWRYEELGNEDFVHALQHEQLRMLNADDDIGKQDIEFFYNNEQCKNIIDVGSWTGVNAFKNFSNVQYEKLILIDGVPLFLNFAKTLFESSSVNTDNIFFNSSCVILAKDFDSFKGYFLADMNNSYSNANCYSSVRNLAIIDPVILTVGNTIPHINFASEIKNLNLDSLFLKINIDGVEMPLLNRLIEMNLLPQVIHLSGIVASDLRKNLLINILLKLREKGYYVPKFSDIFSTTFYHSEFLISKNNFCICNKVRPKNQEKVVYRNY